MRTFGNDEFDSQFKSVKRTAVIGTVISLFITLAVLGFIGWVIVKLMAHFGVL